MAISLNAVTSAGAGASVDLGVVGSAPSMTVTTTGVPAAMRVALEGSMDGTTWVPLGFSAVVTAGALQVNAGPASATVAGTKTARYARANALVLVQPANTPAVQVTATVNS